MALPLLAYSRSLLLEVLLLHSEHYLGLNLDHTPQVPKQAKIPQILRGNVQAWFVDSSMAMGAEISITHLFVMFRLKCLGYDAFYLIF